MDDDGCGGRLTGEREPLLDFTDVKYYLQHSDEGSCLDGGRDSIHPSRIRNKPKLQDPPRPDKGSTTDKLQPDSPSFLSNSGSLPLAPGFHLATRVPFY